MYGLKVKNIEPLKNVPVCIITTLCDNFHLYAALASNPRIHLN